ncbi:MAG: glycogen-binding domain-containing protein, partial [Elusimicrobiota bacterium]
IVNSIIFVFAVLVLVSRYQKSIKKDLLLESKQIMPATKTIDTKKEISKEKYGEPQTAQPIKLRNILFQYKSSKAKSVAIIGDFNDWTPEPLEKKQDNMFQIILKLKPGKYLYNYLVDGQVMTDPNNRKPPVNSPRGFKSSVLLLEEIKLR